MSNYNAKSDPQDYYYALLMRSISSGGLFTGIFSESIMMSLFIMLEKSAFLCFNDIYQYIIKNYPESDHLETMRKAMDTIRNWGNDVQQSETQKVIANHPTIVAKYKPCVMIYVREEFKHTLGGQDIGVTVPPFQNFLCAFFKHLAEDEFVISGEYFRGSRIIERKIANMDAVRAAFNEIVQLNVTEKTVHIARYPIQRSPYENQGLRRIGNQYDDVDFNDSASSAPPPMIPPNRFQNPSTLTPSNLAMLSQGYPPNTQNQYQQYQQQGPQPQQYQQHQQYNTPQPYPQQPMTPNNVYSQSGNKSGFLQQLEKENPNLNGNPTRSNIPINQNQQTQPINSSNPNVNFDMKKIPLNLPPKVPFAPSNASTVSNSTTSTRSSNTMSNATNNSGNPMSGRQEYDSYSNDMFEEDIEDEGSNTSSTSTSSNASNRNTQGGRVIELQLKNYQKPQSSQPLMKVSKENRSNGNKSSGNSDRNQSKSNQSLPSRGNVNPISMNPSSMGRPNQYGLPNFANNEDDEDGDEEDYDDTEFRGQIPYYPPMSSSNQNRGPIQVQKISNSQPTPNQQVPTPAYQNPLPQQKQQPPQQSQKSQPPPQQPQQTNNNSTQVSQSTAPPQSQQKQ